jgi:hypothetical protein
MTETKHKFNALIRDDHRITTSELCTATGTRKLAVMAIIRELGDRKVCARWVPKMLAVEHKTSQKTSTQNVSSTVRKIEMLLCQEKYQ